MNSQPQLGFAHSPPATAPAIAHHQAELARIGRAGEGAVVVVDRRVQGRFLGRRRRLGQLERLPGVALAEPRPLRQQAGAMAGRKCQGAELVIAEPLVEVRRLEAGADQPDADAAAPHRLALGRGQHPGAQSGAALFLRQHQDVHEQPAVITDAQQPAMHRAGRGIAQQHRELALRLVHSGERVVVGVDLTAQRIPCGDVGGVDELDLHGRTLPGRRRLDKLRDGCECPVAERAPETTMADATTEAAQLCLPPAGIRRSGWLTCPPR